MAKMIISVLSALAALAGLAAAGAYVFDKFHKSDKIFY